MKVVFNKIWGLGIAGEFITITSNDCAEQAMHVNLKIFLGPVLLSGFFRIGAWKKIDYSTIKL